MNFNVDALRRFAPLALSTTVVVCGWLFLIGPAATANAQAGRAVDALRDRVARVRVSVAEPPPPEVSDDPGMAFERQVAARDVSSLVLEQLARRASEARATNLLIETGDRVEVGPASGPQVAGGAQPDPRLALFDLSLAYSPISMSFDAPFFSVGDFLWSLRDLATAVEIRSVDIAPPGDDPSAGAAGRDGVVHVSMRMFAYSRRDAATVAVGAVP